MANFDETTVGQALRDLCVAQPAPPDDRLDAIANRAQRMRTRRTGVGVAACAAVVVLAAVVATAWPTLQHTPPTMVGTPVGAWPDRSLPTEQGLANGATREWFRRNGVTESPVRWLFRGTVLQAQPNAHYVAIFLVPADRPAQQLVLAYAQRGQIDEAGNALNPVNGYTPWVIRNVAAPSDNTPIHIGLYFPTAGTTLPITHNVVFVLADPAARRLQYTATPLPYAQAALDQELMPTLTGTMYSADGVFLADVGALAGPLSVVVTDGLDHSSAAGALGFVGARPALAPPRTPNVPANLTVVSGSSGALERQEDGSYAATDVTEGVAQPGARWSVYLRCYGGGDLSVIFEPATYPVSKGTVACDGQSHRAFGPTSYPPNAGYRLTLTGETIQAYNAILGTTA